MDSQSSARIARLTHMVETERDEEINTFILDHYPTAKEWKPEYVSDWAAWTAELGFLHLCYDKPGDEGKLVGICIARPLSITRSRDGFGVLDFDTDGEVLFVDLLVSTAGRIGMKAIMLVLLQRFGDRSLIAFKRLKTQDKFNVYRLKDFARKILGVRG
jgi:hypothetical protein